MRFAAPLHELLKEREEIKRALKLRGGPTYFYLQMENRLLKVDKAIDSRRTRRNRGR